MTILSKPWKEDREIEAQHDVFRKYPPETMLNDINIHRIDTDKNISSLFAYVSREERYDELEERYDELEERYDELEERYDELEERYDELEDRYNRMATQDIDRQNREAIQDIENIFGIDSDDVFDPYEIEGMLSDYSDEQSSTEWVHSVRSGT